MVDWRANFRAQAGRAECVRLVNRDGIPPLPAARLLGQMGLMLRPTSAKIIQSHANRKLQDPACQCGRHRESQGVQTKPHKHLAVRTAIVVGEKHAPDFPHRLVTSFAAAKEPCTNEQEKAESQPDPHAGAEWASEIHVVLTA